MPIDLYYHALSPPCRSVMLTAKAVGVDLNLKKIDVLSGENKTPEFLAINFQHTIPTLVDGNIKLWERYVTEVARELEGEEICTPGKGYTWINLKIK